MPGRTMARSPFLGAFHLGQWRGDILIQCSGQCLGDVLAPELPDDDELLATVGACDSELVAVLDGAMRFCPLRVYVHLSAAARPLRFGPGLEQAGHIKPHV